MPTPTSSTANGAVSRPTRSERLIRLATEAAQDLRLEIKPDEASGTPQTKVEFTFAINSPNGNLYATGHISVEMSESEVVQMHGELSYPGRNDTLSLCPHLGPTIMSGELMDCQRDNRVKATLASIMQRMVADARPRNSKRNRINLGLTPPGDPHAPPTEELATVA